MSAVWRNCSVCKNPINQGGVFQKCSISSCRKSAFCSVDCWDVHSQTLNHKSAWAEEERAPRETYSDDKPRRRIVASKPSSPATNSSGGQIPMDVLVVVSKMKAYIKARSGMNTSGDVNDALSEIIRHECDKAIDKARADGRKTVMARDF